VIEKEKNVYWIRVGVNENGFTVNLEGAREGLAWFRDDAARDLEAIDIGLMFLKTAKSVADGVGGEAEKSEKQEKRGE